MDKPHKGQNQSSQQLLTFLLQEQEYGLELLTIKEIQGYTPVTAIPNVPVYIRGVMNLRGTVLPVVDLRMRFGLPVREYDKFTVVLVAMIYGKMVGLLVDAISDVLTIENGELRPAPDFGPAVDSRFIDSVFQTHDRLAVVLDLDKLLADNEITVVLAAA
jgi:purine-binding chemotaxis protein CheW